MLNLSETVVFLTGLALLSGIGAVTHLCRQRDVLFAAIMLSAILSTNTAIKVLAGAQHMIVMNSIWSTSAIFLTVFSAYRYGYKHAILILSCLFWVFAAQVFAEMQEGILVPKGILQNIHIQAISSTFVKTYVGGLIAVSAYKIIPKNGIVWTAVASLIASAVVIPTDVLIKVVFLGHSGTALTELGQPMVASVFAVIALTIGIAVFAGCNKKD